MINRITRSSPIRYRRNWTSFSCSTVSKNLLISASSWLPVCRSRLANRPHHKCGDTQVRKYQTRLLACLLPYPCQIRSHRFFTPCIVPVFLLPRSTHRGDLRSAGISRFFATPLRLTGPHHSRRGLLLPSSHIGQNTRELADDSPKGSSFVARLVTCLPLCSSMLSSTPGGWLCARLYRTHHLACATLERIGTLPKSVILGAMCQIQGYTLHLAALA